MTDMIMIPNSACIEPKAVMTPQGWDMTIRRVPAGTYRFSRRPDGLWVVQVGGARAGDPDATYYYVSRSELINFLN